MRVTVLGASGLTNAYRSVLSATGSLAMAGASRCDDISLPLRRRGVQAHGEVGVANNEPLRADEERDLAGGEVADVSDEGAGCRRCARAKHRECARLLHRG